MMNQYFLMFQVFGHGIILVKSLRYPGKFLAPDTEVLRKFSAVDDFQERVAVTADFFPDCFQVLWFGHMDSTGQETRSWFAMEIITSLPAPCALSHQIGSKVSLIGRLVFGETNIAVNAKYGILRQQSGKGFIEASHYINEGLYEIRKIVAGSRKHFLVHIEPFAVIVFLQVFQELKGFFHDFLFHGYLFFQ